MNNSPLASQAGLTTVDYLAIVGYLVVTFGVALWFGRKQETSDDFFVGGRRMPWLAVGLSILATLFSTITYLGAPGELIGKGIGFYTGYLAVPFSFAVIAFAWIPFYMRLRLTSAYEYLERRFDCQVRRLGAMLFVLLRLGWMGVVMFVASTALDAIKGGDVPWLPGNDLYWWIAMFGVVASVYTAIGGIQAMIWVDVLQCLLLLSGLLLAIGHVALTDHTGPADWWQTATLHSKVHTKPLLFSTDLTVRVTVVTVMLHNFFWNICTHGSDQVVLQRYFSTASLKSARRSYIINVCVDISMATLLACTGLALLAYYLNHPTLLPEGKSPMEMADKLFPYFLGHQLPAGCAGLIMAAFLCDAIQTLESGANAIAAVIVKDFLSPTHAAPDEPGNPAVRAAAEAAAPSLSVARWLTLVIATLVTMTAFVVAYVQQVTSLSIVDIMPKFFNLFVGPLAAMFFIGMFIRRATARSLFPAVACGLAVSVLWSWWDKLIGSTPPSVFQTIPFSCSTTFGLAFLLSRWESPENPAGERFCWRSVVRASQPDA